MKTTSKLAVILIALFTMTIAADAYAGITRNPKNCRRSIHAPRKNALSRGSRMAKRLAKDARNPICSNIGRSAPNRNSVTSNNNEMPADSAPVNSYSLSCVKDKCCTCNNNTCSAKNDCCLPRAAKISVANGGTAPWITKRTRIDNRLPMLQDQLDRSSTYGYRPAWPMSQSDPKSAQDLY
ncbi:MAG: hypothetical protein GY804_03305 [Alphaproteobacteria bacterium]|nr:hypothetical protein [Alphaproteobacteria bacterium]